MSNLKNSWKTLASVAVVGATAVLVTATVVGALLSTLEEKEEEGEDSEGGGT